jgi:hypothetical protein
MRDHSSRSTVARTLKQSTRTTGRRMPYAVPIRFCSRWGLPCQRRYRRRGALLPHPFSLTRPKASTLRSGRFAFCGTIPNPPSPRLWRTAGRYPASFLAGARTFLSCRHKATAAAAQPSGKAAYNELASIFQQKRPKNCTALAIDDAIDIFRTKTALKSNHCFRAVGYAITVTL